MTVRRVDLRMDDKGRVTIPTNIRKQLGVDGGEADLRLTIEVIEDE